MNTHQIFLAHSIRENIIGPIQSIMDAATEAIDARHDYYAWVQVRELLRSPVRDTVNYSMAENILDYAWEGVHAL